MCVQFHGTVHTQKNQLQYTFILKIRFRAGEVNSVTEHLPSMCKALCSIPTTTKTKTEQNTHKARSQCKTGSRLEGGCDELGEHIVSLRVSHNSAPASFRDTVA
jgi:hypothetical protein